MADGQSRCDATEERTQAKHEHGFGLIEAVVTTTLMAVVMVPIMSAVATSIKSSAQGRSAAQVETALVNAADRVNRAKQDCDYKGVVNGAMTLQGWTADEVSLGYAYYDAPETPGRAGTWVEGMACKPGTSPLDQVQRVTILVSSPDGAIQRGIEVVKSRV